MIPARMKSAGMINKTPVAIIAIQPALRVERYRACHLAFAGLGHPCWKAAGALAWRFHRLGGGRTLGGHLAVGWRLGPGDFLRGASPGFGGHHRPARAGLHRDARRRGRRGAGLRRPGAWTLPARLGQRAGSAGAPGRFAVHGRGRAADRVAGSRRSPRPARRAPARRVASSTARGSRQPPGPAVDRGAQRRRAAGDARRGASPGSLCDQLLAAPGAKLGLAVRSRFQRARFSRPS